MKVVKVMKRRMRLLLKVRDVFSKNDYYLPFFSLNFLKGGLKINSSDISDYNFLQNMSKKQIVL